MCNRAIMGGCRCTHVLFCIFSSLSILTAVISSTLTEISELGSAEGRVKIAGVATYQLRAMAETLMLFSSAYDNLIT